MLHQIVTVGRNLESTLLGLKEFGPDVVHLLLTHETKDICDSLKTMLPHNIKVYEYIVELDDGNQIGKICQQIRMSASGDSLKFIYNLSEETNVMLFATLRIAQEYGDCAFCITQRAHIYFSEIEILLHRQRFTSQV